MTLIEGMTVMINDQCLELKGNHQMLPIELEISNEEGTLAVY